MDSRMILFPVTVVLAMCLISGCTGLAQSEKEITNSIGMEFRKS